MQKIIVLSIALILGSYTLLKSQSGEIKFVENKGQIKYNNGEPAADVLFYGDMGNVKYVIRKTGVSYIVYNETNDEEEEEEEHEQLKAGKLPPPHLRKSEANYTENGYRVDMNWLNPDTTIAQGINPHKQYFNYYTPDFPNGLMGVKSYQQVILKNIYPNIDVLFYSVGTQFKYDYILGPNADPSQVAFAFDGAKKAKVKNDTLFVTAPNLVIKDFIPKSMVQVNNKSIPAFFAFEQKKQNVFTLKAKTTLRDFDKVVIDPSVWITYFGGLGMGGESPYDMESDKNGDLYICGVTGSPSFPVTTGAFSTTISASSSGFVSKFSKAGNLLWSTYYSGTNSDWFRGITIDTLDQVYVCGVAMSTDFPVTAEAFASTLRGFRDGCIVKFDPSGTRLWATYVGGTGYDEFVRMDVDTNNNIWLVGESQSSDFPVTATAIQPVLGGFEDGTITSFSPTGTMLYASYWLGQIYYYFAVLKML